MLIEASGSITPARKIQYFRTLFCGEASCEFGAPLLQIGNTTNTNLNHIIFWLGTYFFPVNYFSKKKRVVCFGMSNPHELISSFYAARMIKLNEYLAVFPGSDMNQKIVLTELIDILLHNMPNDWVKWYLLQGFYFESLSFLIKLTCLNL